MARDSFCRSSWIASSRHGNCSFPLHHMANKPEVKTLYILFIKKWPFPFCKKGECTFMFGCFYAGCKHYYSYQWQDWVQPFLCYNLVLYPFYFRMYPKIKCISYMKAFHMVSNFTWKVSIELCSELQSSAFSDHQFIQELLPCATGILLK